MPWNTLANNQAFNILASKIWPLSQIETGEIVFIFILF